MCAKEKLRKGDHRLIYQPMMLFSLNLRGRKNAVISNLLVLQSVASGRIVSKVPLQVNMLILKAIHTAF
jgi:hypothetical protein